jgi:3-(3-hydroxy-phenyl)propionate hydroxylase
VTDGTGARVRLDDTLGAQWAILYIGAPPSGTQAWTELGVPTVQVSEPELIGWLQRRKATAAVLRPDGFIYAAAGSNQPLPPPPPGHTGNALTTSSKTAASA